MILKGAKIVVAGGGGFLGRALVREIADAGAEVVVLSRSSQVVANARTVLWDGSSTGAWTEELNGACAVVNYAGSPIFTRWTREGKLHILDSRVKSTQAIASAIAEVQRPPAVWVNGSATGFYGDRGARELDESDGPGEGFLPSVCKAWEAAATESSLPRTRLVVLRTGVVLDGAHPPLSLLIKLTRGFAGGAIGKGTAYLPWIHPKDHARLVRFCIESDSSGPVNAVAPISITSGELMFALRHTYHRPWSPPVPATLLRLMGAVGFPSEAVLSSARVVPATAMAAGFQWSTQSLTDMLGK